MEENNKYLSGVNEIENRKTTDKLKKIRSWFLENSHKIDKILGRLPGV